MDLNFELQGSYFIAEFEVTSDFNLHIEKDPIGQFIVYQRTAGGAYDLVADFGKNKGDDPIIDYDFQALVYPKWIKIKSSVKPIIATITTDGEVNEVVYQAKEIEITSNGTTKVTADTGYTALGSVNVKVNVPQSGGSGGGESSIEYIDVRNVEDSDLKFALINSSSLVKIIDGSFIYIYATLFGRNDFNEEDFYRDTVAIAIDFSCKVYYGNGFITIKENISIDNGFPLDVFDSLPRITEEEFYHIPEDVVIPFRDYDKLAEVYETIAKNVFATMPEDSVPVVGYWYDAPSLDIPMMECGYKSVSVVVNSAGGTPTSDIIGRVFKQDSDSNTNNWWQDGLDEEDVRYENVDATYFELKNQATGLCKIVFPDNTVKYMVRKLF
jgi:hypothetical protein